MVGVHEASKIKLTEERQLSYRIRDMGYLNVHNNFLYFCIYITFDAVLFSFEIFKNNT